MFSAVQEENDSHLKGLTMPSVRYDALRLSCQPPGMYIYQKKKKKSSEKATHSFIVYLISPHIKIEFGMREFQTEWSFLPEICRELS